MKSIELKIKLKHLAAECKIIRLEEKKRKGKNWGATGNQYREHRINTVRPEARSTHLAYGYLNGKSYLELERTAKTAPDWRRVEAMVKKYGNIQQKKDFIYWQQKVALAA